ncbi:MAG: hypothetical protein A2Y10_14725 [Planctomycetes bacterium GWF2_41_51]|nr:MAG: hypothetical protein A2Y10_14725 [Planctomycetes bacterium GWF2_41_51]
MTSTLSNVSARNAAFALYQLDFPAVHPDSVIRCIKSVTEYRPALSNIAKSDPSVAIAMLNLCRQHKIEFSFDNLNFDHHIGKISTQNILKAFIGLKTFDVNNLHSQIPIAELNKNSAARAFAARLIAEKTRKANESLSFLAGLFADIGLLALAELYPKSLSRLLEEANGDSSALLRLEKENLGVTHNIISRQLAQKWLLPQAVADSAWLYCVPAVNKLENLANIEIILTVRFADMLVKNINNGSTSSIPSLNEKDVSEIKDKVRNFIAELSISQEKQRDTVFRQALVSLLEKPAAQNYADFQSSAWQAVKPAYSAIEAAGIICNLISKNFNAEKVCIYIDSKKEAVTVSGGTTEFLVFNNSHEINLSPDAKQSKLDEVGELFIQSKTDLDISSIASLVAQILSAKLAEEYNLSIAQALLDDATAYVPPQVIEKQTEPAFSPSQSEAKTIIVPQEMREIIAEIASGAAHELNNPLTVISGRAQILKQNETDETKLLMLNQITEKTGQAYEIVGQLMSYARPAKPQIRTVSPFIMVNNCIEKVNARYLNEPVDITIDSTIENLSDIEVDAEQIAEAISQIIYNALESYESGNGPVIISGSELNSQFVQIRIQDQGCGMSEETTQKAAEPFYSDKPAGRQRGMGLALASSLLRNNNCTISLESEIEKGTIVTIRLPRTGKSQ